MAAMSLRWWLREQTLDSAMRSGGERRRTWCRRRRQCHRARGWCTMRQEGEGRAMGGIVVAKKDDDNDEDVWDRTTRVAVMIRSHAPNRLN